MCTRTSSIPKPIRAQRTPRSCEALQTCAWFPAEQATRPDAFSSGLKFAILLYLPAASRRKVLDGCKQTYYPVPKHVHGSRYCTPSFRTHCESTAARPPAAARARSAELEGEYRLQVLALGEGAVPRVGPCAAGGSGNTFGRCLFGAVTYRVHTAITLYLGTLYEASFSDQASTCWTALVQRFFV